MYSIHKATVVAAAAIGLIALGGCQATWTRPQPVNDRPLTIDPAMQARDWPQSQAHYASGAVVAGPIWGPPWQEQTYRGAYWEPTYTAQPPLEVIPYEGNYPFGWRSPLFSRD